MAQGSGELVSQYLNRSVQSALQSYDPGNGQTFDSLSDSINTGLITTIRNIVGVSGGMGLNAIFSNIGGFTMTKDTTVQTLKSELTDYQNQLTDAQDSILGIKPTVQSSTSDVNTFMNSVLGNTNSQSTPTF